MGAFFLTTSIIFNTVANGFFKSASALGEFSPRKWTLLGVGLFVGLLNTLAYLKALETVRLSTAYAVFASASTLLIALMSMVHFGEPMTLHKGIGLTVICLGLLILWKG